LTGKVFESLGLGSQGNANLLSAVIFRLANKEAGGLAGMVEAYQQKSFGDLMSSWIRTGKNLPISPDQLIKGIGEVRLRTMAEQAGMSTESISSQLTDLLPHIIDKLTPDGTLRTVIFSKKV
jgi:uncharacterized protein YidB (DUF937 family)